MENAKKCIAEALDSPNIRRKNRKIILKEEQERAVQELFVFSSAEKVPEKPFLNGLKSQTVLHVAVSAIVVDECHTVEFCRIPSNSVK